MCTSAGPAFQPKKSAESAPIHIKRHKIRIFTLQGRAGCQWSGATLSNPFIRMQLTLFIRFVKHHKSFLRRWTEAPLGWKQDPCAPRPKRSHGVRIGGFHDTVRVHLQSKVWPWIVDVADVTQCNIDKCAITQVLQI